MTVELGFVVLAAVLVTLMAVLSSHARRIVELEQRTATPEFRAVTPADQRRGKVCVTTGTLHDGTPTRLVTNAVDMGSCQVCGRPAVVAMWASLTHMQSACAEHEAYVAGLLAEHPGFTKARVVGSTAHVWAVSRP